MINVFAMNLSTQDDTFSFSLYNHVLLLHILPLDEEPLKTLIMDFYAIVAFVVSAMLFHHADGQTCGLVTDDGDIIPPAEFQWKDPLPYDYPPGGEFWRHATVNVTGSTTPHDSHTKYLTGLRRTTSYAFAATGAFATFLTDEDTYTIVRTSNFKCADNSTTSYTFRIPVLSEDEEEPTFLDPDYTFNITEDWNPNVAMNQGKFIIVGDRDMQVENARLTFSTVPEGVIEAEAHQLWPDSNPPEDGNFYYRVDLYYRPEEDKTLNSGSYEFILVANSRNHTSEVIFMVNVV